jgi:hypothetical protein
MGVDEWMHDFGDMAELRRQETGKISHKNLSRLLYEHVLPQEVFVELSARGLRIPAYKVSVRLFYDVNRKWNWQQSQ